MAVVAHRMKDHWVVAENRVWLPGLYASEAAAHAAAELDPETLQDLWEHEGPRPLTVVEIRELLARK